MAHKCDGCKYKSVHQEMMFRPFGVCSKEINLIEAEKAYNAEKCPYKKTNADRIRAMSDEELAIHLHDFGWDCHLCAEHRRLDNEPLLRGEKCDENCMGHCLEWLKQPVEE